ncbi:hypothetical protein K502DRAFT_353967, partial [Neoconidiobolus thromboides FSU 785]
MKSIIYSLTLFLINIASPIAVPIQNNTNPITRDTRWYTKQITDNTIEPSISNAMLYVNYAAAVSCDNISLKTWTCKSCQNVQGTELVTTFSNILLGTKGYLAVNNNDQAIILTFRGSQNLMNWISNIEVAQIPFSSASGSGARVHSGFLGAMESIS